MPNQTTTIPMLTVSETNQREHWAKRHTRRKRQRRDAYWWCKHDLERPTNFPVTITLTRLAPRRLDAGNLPASVKAAQDGIADWLGIDDGDQRIEWRYMQERDKAQAVRIEIEG